MSTADKHPFRDPTNIRNLTVGFLLLYLLATLLALWSGLLEYQFIQNVNNGVFQTDARLEQVATANDNRQLIVSIFQTGFRIILAFLVLRWIYVACVNAHSLCGTEMKITPGWSVGWYFIPLANLLKPFHAMLEIWHVSHRPDEAVPDKTPMLLGAWWFFWINSIIVGRIASRLSLSAESLEEFESSNIAYLATDSLIIPLTVLLILIINKIHQAQIRQAAKPTTKPPAIPIA